MWPVTPSVRSTTSGMTSRGPLGPRKPRMYVTGFDVLEYASRRVCVSLVLERRRGDTCQDAGAV